MRIIKIIIKNCILFFYRIMTRILPLRKDIVIFESNLGRNYLGNPKAIYEEMVRRGLDKTFRCYYILDMPSKVELPGRGKKVKNSRFFYYYIMAVAGTWICDTRFQNYVIKRKGVTYIQTWHGTPLKKLALDMDKVDMAESKDIKEYHNEFLKNSATWDYLISQNPFSSETFRRAFAFCGELLEIGYPRNDVLFTGNMEKNKKILNKKYGIPDNKKVMLYAPTWRDNSYYDKTSYKFETNLDFKKMQEAFEEEYILIVKYHYLVCDNIDWDLYKGFIKRVKADSDIAELYLITDLLITDYSSVMFDYSILRRPMFFYVYDYLSYKNILRGFYFDLEKEAPGPMVTETEELILAIRNYNFIEHEKNYEAFCKKYNTFDDGHAAEKTVDLVISTILH